MTSPFCDWKSHHRRLVILNQQERLALAERMVEVSVKALGNDHVATDDS